MCIQITFHHWQASLIITRKVLTALPAVARQNDHLNSFITGWRIKVVLGFLCRGAGVNMYNFLCVRVSCVRLCILFALMDIE